MREIIFFERTLFTQYNRGFVMIAARGALVLFGRSGAHALRQCIDESIEAADMSAASHWLAHPHFRFQNTEYLSTLIRVTRRWTERDPQHSTPHGRPLPLTAPQDPLVGRPHSTFRVTYTSRIDCACLRRRWRSLSLYPSPSGFSSPSPCAASGQRSPPPHSCSDLRQH